MDSVINFFNEVSENIKAFFIEHGQNPFLWIGIIILGLIVFEYLYGRLNNEK